MRRFVNMTAVLTLVYCLLGQGRADDKPALRLEVRRAQSTAARDLQEATVPRTGEKIYIHKTAEVTNEDVAEAVIEEDIGDRFLLKLRFTKQGAARMEKLTREHRDKPLAVLVDGKVLVAPVIRSTITDQAVLSGIAKPELDRIVKGLKAK